MSTAYVITSGSYSDYGIAHVLLDKAEAEALVVFLGDYYEIEEYELADGWASGPLTDELTISTILWSDGVVETHESHEGHLGEPHVNEHQCQHDVSACAWGTGRATDHPNGPLSLGPTVRVTVRGLDHQRVRKVSSEQIAQAKADYLILITKAIAERAERDARYGWSRNPAAPPEHELIATAEAFDATVTTS